MLLGLIRKVRSAANLEILGFLLVNETHLLTPYRQAVLWCATPGQGRIIALSGAAVIESDAPYVMWLNRLVKHLVAKHSETALVLTAADLPDGLAKEWHEWLPEYLLWLPLGFPTGQIQGGLLLAREQPWTPLWQELLTDLSGVYAMALAGVLAQRPFRNRLAASPLFKITPLVSAVLVVGLLLMPVGQSVLAPAHVVPAEPVMVRATMDGVVERLHVAPNEVVRKDQPLMTLHGARLRNESEVADKEREVLLAEYRHAAQKSLWDQPSKSQAEILKKKLEQKETQTAYMTKRLERLILRAPQDGVAIFNDPNDWIGRPVATGESLLMVADPDRSALRIDLAVADAITLTAGARMELFLNMSPDTPLPAVLRHASFAPEVTPEGMLAYRLYADFTDPARRPPRLGLRGTVRIYRQERVSLFHLLFRRPMAVARQWIGF